MTSRIVIVGGVAGGMSAATRARRVNERAEITVLEKSGHISFANCGLPYFISGKNRRRAESLPHDARARERTVSHRCARPSRGYEDRS
ncbi:MAG: FAD-dependent oxidoreductase [Polyangiaceae bacterium]